MTGRGNVKLFGMILTSVMNKLFRAGANADKLSIKQGEETIGMAEHSFGLKNDRSEAAEIPISKK